MCGDAMDIVDGHPTGSVRISFGYMSTLEDARKFVEFITNTFLIPVSIETCDEISDLWSHSLIEAFELPLK